MTKDLGSSIQMFLTMRGMSRKELAERTGVTEVTIGRYINGEREPKAITVAAMSSALGVSVNELVGVEPTSAKDLEVAVRLVARNAGDLTPDEKKALISALVSD